MVVKVCVGSSCHLRGSYEDEVDLQATFCVGNCMNGVSVISDGVLVHNANKDNAEELFLTEVVSRLKK